MTPEAMKNLHACENQLKDLLNSTHVEDVERNLAAFVNSARNTTFVLQKEFNKDPQFIKWYGDSKKTESLNKPEKGTKQYEMKNDEVCKFFHNLRNKIGKEGSYGLQCSTNIDSMNTESDYPDWPVDSNLEIGAEGIYFRRYPNTSKEDLIPAKSSTAKISTKIYISNAPTQHLGQKIENPNLLIITQLYYKYLKNLVEEWTGIMNDARLVSPIIS